MREIQYSGLLICFINEYFSFKNMTFAKKNKF